MSVTKAKEKAPIDAAVLWLAYQEAEREKDYDAALLALAPLFQADPHNVFVLLAEAKAYSMLGRMDDAHRVALELMQSKRYIDQSQRDKIRMILEQN